MRCVHEASLHNDNAFITLTYDDEHVPDGFTLVKKHFQDFMKRLRWHQRDRRIRFYACGEYGGKTQRPHYHACLFGTDFDDKEIYSERDGVRLYHSQELTDIWGKGFASTGDVTFESAAYVARYIMKKVTGDLAPEHYETVDAETGEIFQREPEYTNMSNRPGLGRDWIDKYQEETYRDDTVIMRGHPMRPPKYYDGLQDPSLMEQIKDARARKAHAHAKDQTPDRLETREKVKRAQIGHLKRGLD